MLKIELDGNIKYYKRVFVLSDIHGQYQRFNQLRKFLQWNKYDLVIIAGDIVDRGPNPREILDDLMGSPIYDCICLKGNHELWLSEAISAYIMTGVETYQYNSLGILVNECNLRDMDRYANWMAKLPTSLEMRIDGWKKPFKICHASTANMKNVGECTLGKMDFYADCLTDCELGRYTNIVGHTVTSYVRRYLELEDIDNNDILKIGDRLWCIDCGCGYIDLGFPGKLGCVEIREGERKEITIKEHYV